MEIATVSEEYQAEIITLYLADDHKLLVKTPEKFREFALESVLIDMYGGWTNLHRHSFQFQAFPESHVVFGLSWFEPLKIGSSLLKSLGNGSYTYQRFIYGYLSQCMQMWNSTLSVEVVSLMNYYLRVKEQYAGKIHELISYSQDKLDVFMKVQKKELSKIITIEKQFRLVDQTPSEVIEKFKRLFPENKKDTEFETIRNFLKTYFRKKPVRKNKKYYETWLNLVAINIRNCEKLMESHPKWFLSQTNRPARVRVFINAQTNFVMAHELFSEMVRAGLDYRLIEEEVLSKPSLTTWFFMDVFEKIGKETMEQIEFVECPIQRTSHRALYIPTIDGKYCVLALDAVWETLYDLISIKCLFQDLSKREMDILCGFVSFMVDYFTVELEFGSGYNLINVDVIADFKCSLLDLMQKSIPDVISKRKVPVARVTVIGFNGEYLKNEIRRLGLEKTFPEITKFADQTVNALKSHKRENKLKNIGNGDLLDTSDMFLILHLCQVKCLVGRCETLAQFFHDFQFCAFLQVDCSQCKQEKGEDSKHFNKNKFSRN